MREIVFGKLVDKTIEQDYADLSESLFGEGNCFHSTEVRKRLYGMKAILEAMERDCMDAIGDTELSEELRLQQIELQKERQKLSDQRTAYRKLIREQARREELREVLVEAVATLPSYQSSVPCGEILGNMVNNDLLVSLNDIHFGADIQNHWNTYNSDVCKDMMDKYAQRIIEIAGVHGSENCVIWANGDQISGNIHHTIALENKENVVQQLMGVSELISSFISKLSPYFRKVSYVSVAGNHSRIDTKDRSPKDERLDDLVEWYLAARLQNLENVHIGDCQKIDSTMYLVNVRGKAYLGVHGDYDGSKLKIQTLPKMAGVEVYAVLLGHLHHNAIDTVQRLKTIMAGSFLGMDDYCITKRIYGHPEQLVCVCGEDGLLCSYDVGL